MIEQEPSVNSRRPTRRSDNNWPRARFRDQASSENQLSRVYDETFLLREVTDAQAAERKPKLRPLMKQAKGEAMKRAPDVMAYLRKIAKQLLVLAKRGLVLAKIAVRKIRAIPFKTYYQRFSTRFNRKQKIVMAVVAGFIVINAIGLGINSHQKNSPKDVLGANSTNPGSSTSTDDQKPEFSTVLPDGDVTDTSSGKLAYSADKKVASFTDAIDTNPVTVSQQAMPPSFKGNEAIELKKLADQIYATQPINAGSITAYLGQSINGPQTVVLTMNGLLIFIKSDVRIDNALWASYIQTLK